MNQLFLEATSLIDADMLAAFNSAFQNMLATIKVVLIAGVPAVMTIIVFSKAAQFMLKWAKAQLSKLA